MQNGAKPPQIAAERSKNNLKLMQNAAKWHQINAERSKTAPNLYKIQQNGSRLMQNAHSLEKELIL